MTKASYRPTPRLASSKGVFSTRKHGARGGRGCQDHHIKWRVEAMFEVGKFYSVTMADGTTYNNCEVLEVDMPLIKIVIALEPNDQKQSTILNTGSREFVAAQLSGPPGA